MAAHGARRLMAMADNVGHVVAIELLAAAQGYDFHAPLRSSDAVQAIHDTVRDAVPPLVDDRYFHPDIAAATAIVRSGRLTGIADSHGIPVPSVIHD